MVNENDNLKSTVKQIEKDTIDVVAYLKVQDSEKDNEVGFQCMTLFEAHKNIVHKISKILKLQQELKSIRAEHQKEKDEIVSYAIAKFQTV